MVNITKVLDLGNDVLEVHGFYDGDPLQELVANGWLSATTNFYPADQYSKDGHLIEDAACREMTDTEKLTYYRSLFLDNSDRGVLFSDPEAIATQEAAVEAAAVKEETEDQSTMII